MSDDELPVPDDLLVPLIEAAADILRGLDSVDVPKSLAPIHGFDRRGLLAGPARRQLLKAVRKEATFRMLAVDAFNSRDEVVATRDEWNPAKAPESVAVAAARGDLPLLASMLWANPRLPGAEFGLGLIVARSETDESARHAVATADERERELDALSEARRRSDLARIELEADIERLQADLQKERGVRREREVAAIADASSLQREVEQLSALLGQARAELDEERLRAAREAKRARALEDDVKKARAESIEARTESQAVAARLDERDARAVSELAAVADKLAAALHDLEEQARIEAAAPVRSAPAPRSPEPRPAAPTRRALPTIPPGMMADSPEGVDAMLRTPDLLLVVDGYNVSKRAWGDASAADQRERLAIAITALCRRTGCNVLIVFDGDGSGIVRAPLRRGGVRVVFSDAGEEADEVVVREVGNMPKRVPVVVASSDAWVRQHASSEGAVVVGADALLRVLRPAR